MAADVAGVDLDGVLGGAAAVGGEADARASAVGPVFGALDEPALLHAGQLVRDAALVPVERLGEFADAQLAAVGAPELHQDAELSLRDPAVLLQAALQLPGEQPLGTHPDVPERPLLGLQGSHLRHTVEEYNHSIPGALKNALDYVYREWNDKAAGIVSYGGWAAGVRAAETLRIVLAELQVATVRAQPAIALHPAFATGAFVAQEGLEDAVNLMLDQVIAWAGALHGVREGRAVAAA